METCHQALVTQMAVVRIQSVALEDRGDCVRADTLWGLDG